MAKKNNSSPVLDLHGDRLLDLEDKVDRFIMQSKNKGLSEIRIMTGKGTGKVLAAVQKYLKLGGYPFHFEKKSNNQINEGVLIVHI
jgi:dsDNA-specific endonuclease/ATPase MutS2